VSLCKWLVSSCLICKFLCKKLKILLAFAVMLLMCVSHDILLDKVIPKYFAVFTVTSMLNHLIWNTLENRRNINRVTMLYKITHNLVAIDPNLYLVKQPIMHTRNSNILQLFNTRTNYFKYSYFPKSLRSY
jgi:hypothetical protein